MDNKYRHEIIHNPFTGDKLFVEEELSSIVIDGVIYYDDLPELVRILNKIIIRNRDICYLKGQL